MPDFSGRRDLREIKKNILSQLSAADEVAPPITVEGINWRRQILDIRCWRQ